MQNWRFIVIMLHTTSEMGSKGGEDSQQGWWGQWVVKVGWGWQLYMVQLQRERVEKHWISCTWGTWGWVQEVAIWSSQCFLDHNCDLYSIFLTNTNGCLFVFFPIQFIVCWGHSPDITCVWEIFAYCLWWSIIACCCLNNKSQIYMCLQNGHKQCHCPQIS